MVKRWMTAIPNWISGEDELNGEVVRASEYDELREAVRKYLAEYDNPAPDFSMRSKLRADLRRVFNMPEKRNAG